MLSKNSLTLKWWPLFGAQQRQNMFSRVHVVSSSGTTQAAVRGNAWPVWDAPRTVEKGEGPNSRCSSNKIGNEGEQDCFFSQSVWLGYDWLYLFTSKFVLLLWRRQKTTMNILGQEINKSRINIYAPEGMWVVFTVPSEIFDPSHRCDVITIKGTNERIKDVFDHTLKSSSARPTWSMYGHLAPQCKVNKEQRGALTFQRRRGRLRLITNAAARNMADNDSLFSLVTYSGFKNLWS